MAKRYIKQFITQQLGQYLENLDSATDIQFSMSEAILQLENVTFKEDALTKLKLPVQIKHGRVRKLDVSFKVSRKWIRLIGTSAVANHFVDPSANNLRRNRLAAHAPEQRRLAIH